MGQGRCRNVYFPGGLTSSRVSGMKIITYGCDNMPLAFFDDRYHFRHFPVGKNIFDVKEKN